MKTRNLVLSCSKTFKFKVYEPGQAQNFIARLSFENANKIILVLVGLFDHLRLMTPSYWSLTRS